MGKRFSEHQMADANTPVGQPVMFHATWTAVAAALVDLGVVLLHIPTTDKAVLVPLVATALPMAGGWIAHKKVRPLTRSR